MVSEGVVALWTLESGEVKVGENRGEKVRVEPVRTGAGRGGGEKKEL